MTVPVLSFVVGLFFVLARFRFFYDPSKRYLWNVTKDEPGSCWLNGDRHESLTSKIVHCGWNKWPKFWMWFTAIVEVIGGLSMMLNIGRLVFAPLILGVLVFATICTAKNKVLEQRPVDKIDVLACYLWRVEGLYIVMTALVVYDDWVKVLG